MSLAPPHQHSGMHSRDVRLRVLVIEDDVHVRHVIAELLSDHDVVKSINGRDGLDMLRVEQTFDLVFCDLMMPVMTGFQLHDAVSRELPHMLDRIVFMTGCPFAPDVLRFKETARNEVISKPFTQDVIARLVATANDRKLSFFASHP